MLNYMKECILHSSRVTVPLLIVLAVAAGTFLWPLSYGPSVYAQDPTETPTPAPTDTPPPTNTPQPTATATPFPTNTPEPTWTPAPTNTPLPTNSPVPTNTPPPTFTPVPVEQRVAPGGAIFINCGPGEPCIDLHSSHTDISVDELAVLSFSIVNSLGKPAMLSRLILELPSGWSMDGEGFADKCSGLCSANYSIPTGEQECKGRRENVPRGRLDRRVWAVVVQDKCPPKRSAEMSPVYWGIVSDVDAGRVAGDRRVGGVSVSM